MKDDKWSSGRENRVIRLDDECGRRFQHRRQLQHRSICRQIIKSLSPKPHICLLTLLEGKGENARGQEQREHVCVDVATVLVPSRTYTQYRRG